MGSEDEEILSEERPTPVTIKKYPNRRMYDTANSRYVNLAQIAEMIKGGEIVEVVDATSGEDLTKVILAQIILEEEKGNRNLLPVEFLHEIIKYGESTYGDFLKGFLASSFEAYQQAQQQMESAWRKWVPEWPKVPGWPTPGEPGDELDELKHRIAELEERLAKQRSKQD
jgi:polyhydroxyalkanoate synthesis repressor PhaR